MWDTKYTDELKQKRAKATIGGGEDQIARQHSRDKLTARERLEALFDDNSFVEVNDLVTSRATDFGMDKKKKPGDGVVTGYGTIHGRITFAASQDFTVGGGSLGEAQAIKICRIMDKALEMKAPLVFINDSGGARIEEGIDGLSGYADIFYRNTMASGVIPQISVILGPCAGGACYSPAIADYIFMTKNNSQMFITGPDVVRSVTGEEISASDLGGAYVHSSISGVAHFVYDTELDCLNGVRRLLGYLPQNNEEKSMTVEGREIDRSVELTTGSMVYMAAALAGVDIVDCALSPFANGTSQPGTESLVAALKGTERDTGLDLGKLSTVASHFRMVAAKMEQEGLISTKVLRVNPNALLYQVPGGMLSNLISQLNQADAEDRYEEVLAEVPVVRADFGYPPLVTPTSQIIGTQAVLNVLMGRYRSFTKESKALLKGEYGALPGKVNEEVRRKAIGTDELITCRPADLLKPEMESIMAKYLGLCKTEEDVLSCALFPQVASEYIKRRDDLIVHEIDVDWTETN